MLEHTGAYVVSAVLACTVVVLLGETAVQAALDDSHFQRECKGCGEPSPDQYPAYVSQVERILVKEIKQANVDRVSRKVQSHQKVLSVDQSAHLPLRVIEF